MTSDVAAAMRRSVRVNMRFIFQFHVSFMQMY